MFFLLHTFWRMLSNFHCSFTRDLLKYTQEYITKERGRETILPSCKLF